MYTNGSLLAAAIEHHLELKRRNQHLDDALPLEDYRDGDPFANHPLFKTEADARREEEETGEHPAVSLEDTESMPVVEVSDEPRGWMDTTTATEFSWD